MTVLITGGAGFIGTNLADRLLEQGSRVVLLDNLSRSGVGQNVDWLQARHGGAVQFMHEDVRDKETVNWVVSRASAVFHLAAQVAVTTSLTDPLDDFETNVVGTMNVLEALRQLDSPPPLIYTSTNKVYGGLPDVALRLTGKRYEAADPDLRSRGIGESRPLNFCTPYGCSKGAADQYVLDYSKSFGLPACVFRMSCIYGPHQFGTEDQGWVAHFLIRAMEGGSISIYGDGYQIRDILYVDDLINAFQLAHANMDRCSGNAFNIGGGPERTVSLRELLDMMEVLGCGPQAVHYEDSRQGDQRYYVSDTSKFRATTAWCPKMDPRNGVATLFEWLTHSHAGSAQTLELSIDQ